MAPSSPRPLAVYAGTVIPNWNPLLLVLDGECRDLMVGEGWGRDDI